MSICENCGKKTVVIYAVNEGNVCGECKDKINGEAAAEDIENE